MSRDHALALAIRLVRLGRGGFDLGLIGLPTPADEGWFMDGLERALAEEGLILRRVPAEALGVDPLGALQGGGGAVVVHGLHGGHGALASRLNVQRDALARGVGVPLLLLGHPAGVRVLADHAPDLVDYASLREVVGAPPLPAEALRVEGLRPAAPLDTGDPLWDRLWLSGDWSALALRLQEALTPGGAVDPRRRAVAARALGRLRHARGEVDGALDLLQEALAAFVELGDRRERAVTLVDIARIREQRGDVDGALKLLQEALAVFEELGDRRSRAATLGDIARIQVDKGEVDGALALHEEALAVFEALGDRRSRAVTLGDIARIQVGKGEVDAALKRHEEALAVYEALGDRRGRAITLANIARIRFDKGDHDGALRLLQDALTTFEALGDRRERAVTLGDIARIRFDKGDHDGALRLLQDALTTFEALGDRRERATTLANIAHVRALQGATAPDEPAT